LAEILAGCKNGVTAAVEGVLDPRAYISKDGLPKVSLDVRVDRIRKAKSAYPAEKAAENPAEFHEGLEDELPQPPIEAPPIKAGANPFKR
jgi:single-stranded DNA-binding protein